MSDVTVSPKDYPELAAHQLVIELIRAGKVSGSESGKYVIAIYENILKEINRINSEN
ncbi:hypothetical protein Q4Q99_14355 [Morganella morganii]